MKKIPTTNDYISIFFVIFIISMFIMSFLNYLITNILKNIPWWIELPSAFGIFGILFIIFETFLWKEKPINLIVKIPNLNGRWEGHLKSSYDQKKKYPIRLEIIQTFSNISISIFTPNSSSHSIEGHFVELDNKNIELHYEYRNEPKYLSDDDLEIHYGIAHLEYHDKNNEIEGKYYNSSRNRGRYGELYLKYQTNRLQNRFKD